MGGCLLAWIVTSSGPGGALVSEGAGELAAEPGVLVGELLVALQGGGEAGALGGAGGPLAGGDRGAGGAAGAQLLDLVADVGLGVEPGPGDAGGCGDGGECDGRSGPVELAQGADCPGAGQLVPAGGGGGQRGGRVRTHRRLPPVPGCRPGAW